MASSGASEEIRRRERVIRNFPNRESAMRLLGALLMEQDEAWSTGKRYFDMTAYWQWRESTAGTLQKGGFEPTP
jgi:putative transposase